MCDAASVLIMKAGANVIANPGAEHWRRKRYLLDRILNTNPKVPLANIQDVPDDLACCGRALAICPQPTDLADIA